MSWVSFATCAVAPCEASSFCGQLRVYDGCDAIKDEPPGEFESHRQQGNWSKGFRDLGSFPA